MQNKVKIKNKVNFFLISRKTIYYSNIIIIFTELLNSGILSKEKSKSIFTIKILPRLSDDE
jgi:hypothetical protein